MCWQTRTKRPRQERDHHNDQPQSHCFCFWQPIAQPSGSNVGQHDGQPCHPQSNAAACSFTSALRSANNDIARRRKPAFLRATRNRSSGGHSNSQLGCFAPLGHGRRRRLCRGLYGWQLEQPGYFPADAYGGDERINRQGAACRWLFVAHDCPHRAFAQQQYP